MCVSGVLTWVLTVSLRVGQYLLVRVIPCHCMSLNDSVNTRVTPCQDSVTWCTLVSLCEGMVSTGPRETLALYLSTHQHILHTNLCGGQSNTVTVFISYKTNTLSQTTHDTATRWSLCHRQWLLQNSNGPCAAHHVYSMYIVGPHVIL